MIPTGNTTGLTVDYKNVIPATTKVLDSLGESNLSVSTDGLTLTMSSASPIGKGLTPGDVLIAPPTPTTGPAPKGLIRKVLSSTVSGQQIVVVTVVSNMAEAFQRAAFSLQEHLNTASIAAIVPAPGVHFRSAQTSTAVNKAISRAITSIVNPCKGYSVGIFDIPEAISSPLGGGITVSGSFELCSAVSLSLDLTGEGFLGLAPQLNSFAANATFGDFADLTVTSAVGGSASSGRIPLATVTFNPIPVTTPIAGLPLWVTPEVVVFVGGNVSALSSLSSEATGSATYSTGVSWLPTTGWTQIPLQTSSQFDFQPPQFLATLDAKEYAGVELALYAWDTLGLVFAPQGYYELQADTSKNPLWTLTGGFEGPVSLKAKFIGIAATPDFNLGNAFANSSVLAAGPVLQTVTPAIAMTDDTSASLVVTGSNFTDAAVIKFGTTSLATTKQSSAQLMATVPASLLLTPGTMQVTVDDLGSGGTPLTDPAHFAETSNSLPFSILDPSVTITPSTISLAPGKTTLFTATVTGGGQIDWSVREGTGGSITNSGLYTASSTVGVYHVVATNHANPSHFAVAVVNITTQKYTFTTIHYPGALYTDPAGINTNGDIVGIHEAAGDTNPSGFLYSNGTFTQLLYPPAPLSSPADYKTQPAAINDSGQIVGVYLYKDGFGNGFIYSNGVYAVIRYPGSANTQTSPTGINNTGQIVGWYFDQVTHVSHGFLYSAGAFTTFDYPGAMYTLPAGINDSGQIVGYSQDSAGIQHCFLYSNGTFTVIDLSSNYAYQIAGINDSGQMVGVGGLYQNGSFTQLGVPNCTEQLTGIGGNGSIVGYCYGGNNGNEGFLATPIP